MKRVTGFALVLCMLAPVGGWAEAHIDTLRVRAEAGDLDAQVYLADYYHDGISVEQDYEKALYWYQKAVENEEIYGPKHYAYYSLGLLYFDGHGVAQNYEQAIYWWRKAAKSHVLHAQYNLGVVYYNGLGVPKDYEEAAKWWRVVAETYRTVYPQSMELTKHLQDSKRTRNLTIAEAQRNLGELYARGRGVTQDYKQSYIWFSVAVAGGLDDSDGLREKSASHLSPDELREAQKEAGLLFDKLNSQFKQDEESGSE